MSTINAITWSVMGILALIISCQPVFADEYLLPEYSRIYSPDRDPFKDGVAAIRLARSSGKNVLIQVGGNWCGWCKKLEATIDQQPKLNQTLRANYVVLKVNVSNANDNKAFTKGLPRLSGYPQLFIANTNGKIVHAQDPSEFVKAGNYQPHLILSFLQRWIPQRDGKREVRKYAPASS